MFNQLSKKIREHAKSQSTDLMKRYYEDIADALGDEEFIQTLSNTEALNRLDNLQSNLRGYTYNRLADYISSTQPYNDALNLVNAGYIAYRADKKRNISIFSQTVRRLEDKLKESEEKIEDINRVASILSGAEILEAYAKDFDNQAMKHQKNSANWLKYLIFSVVGLVVIVALLMFVQISNLPNIRNWLADDIKSIGTLNTIALVIKASVIMAYIQIPLFIRKNYFAEKHLEQSSIHRRNVLKALHAVYKTISNQEEKDKIITVGATIAFSEPESGFITRKEGAGGDDNLEAILKIVSK